MDGLRHIAWQPNGKPVEIRVKLGDDVFRGTALTTTRFRDLNGRDVVQIELVDAINL